MKISDYWARDVGTAVNPEGFSHRLVCWFGSNESSEHAKLGASKKLADWKNRFSKGESLIDEYPYDTNGIREAVIRKINDENGSLIGAITRNRYGAEVLNAHQVMFIDVDEPFVNPPGIFSRIFSAFNKKSEEPEQTDAINQTLLNNFKEFQKNNPDLSFRVYKTAAGFRLVVLNQLIDPLSTLSDDILKSLESDQLYQYLCKNQVCFRARLTPKPWRCEHKRPPNHFPRENDDQEQLFDQWLNEYEKKSTRYSVCTLIETLGDAPINPTVEKILKIHDEYVLDSSSKVLA